MFACCPRLNFQHMCGFITRQAHVRLAMCLAVTLRAACLVQGQHVAVHTVRLTFRTYVPVSRYSRMLRTAASHSTCSLSRAYTCTAHAHNGHSDLHVSASNMLLLSCSCSCLWAVCTAHCGLCSISSMSYAQQLQLQPSSCRCAADNTATKPACYLLDGVLLGSHIRHLADLLKVPQQPLLQSCLQGVAAVKVHVAPQVLCELVPVPHPHARVAQVLQPGADG